MPVGKDIENVVTFAEIVFAVWLAKHGYVFFGGALFGATICCWIQRRLKELGSK